MQAEFFFFLSFFFEGWKLGRTRLAGRRGRTDESRAWERERGKRGEGWQHRDPRRDSSIRDRRETGRLAVRRYFPPPEDPRRSLLLSDCYLHQVACTVLTLFETGPFVYRYVAPSAEYWPKGSHRKRVEGCRRREGCRTPSLILHVAFLLSFFPLPHSSFFFFFSPLLPRGSRRWSSLDREFFIKLTRPVDSFGRQISDWWSCPLLFSSPDKKLVLRDEKRERGRDISRAFKYSLFWSVSDGRVCSHVQF